MNPYRLLLILKGIFNLWRRKKESDIEKIEGEKWINELNERYRTENGYSYIGTYKPKNYKSYPKTKMIINIFDKKYNRMNRKQYFVWILIQTILLIILSCLTAGDFLNFSLLLSIVVSFVIVAYPFVRIFTLRSHDFGCSGLLSLIFFIPLLLIIGSVENDSLDGGPLVGICILIILIFVSTLIFIEGDKGVNKYGTPPR